MDDETVEEVTGETYGPMKALCEKAVADAFANRTTIVRPGYIVGPGDRTDRWTYWPVRVQRGGDMLAPGEPSDPVQIIDARDLAAFVVDVLERKVTGKFNAVGPGSELSMGAMLETMKETTGADVRFVWVAADKLAELNASVPIWNAPDGEYAGVHRTSNARAVAEGMTFTPLAATIRDTLAWWNSLAAERSDAMRSGLRVVAADDGQRPGPLSIDAQMEIEAQLLAGIRA